MPETEAKTKELYVPYSTEAILIASLMKDLNITSYIVPDSFKEPTGMIIDLNPFGNPTVRIV